MPNDKWDDDHIENLLRDFPAIKDERPKEEVFRRLKNAQEPSRKSRKWVPYLVAALAFITFGVLLASMLGQQSNDSASEMSRSGGTEESADSQQGALENNAESEGSSVETESSGAADTGESSDAFTAMESADKQAALSVYGDELEGSTLLTLGMTENALVIPVSFIIPDERLLEDFGSTEVGAAELYNRYAAEIDEEALGFDDYHPYIGSIEETTDGIVHVLPEEHSYDLASASLTVYLNSLAASFPDAAEISIVDETGGPAVLDQAGTVEALRPGPENIAYYSYSTANGSTYLMPGLDMPHEDAAAALEAMKTSPNDLFASLIPEGLDFSVSETAETVTVEFEESADFNAYDRAETVRMIEGMVLAADSFGKELEFSNTAASAWERFDFTEPLPVPAGINAIEY